jgi:hypothetical protein
LAPAQHRTGRVRHEARVEIVSDEATKKAVDNAYEAKYCGQGIALRQAVTSPTATTP